MNKYILIILLILISKPLIGQTWSPPGANWKYSFLNLSGDGYVEIKYLADTLINNQTVKILEKSRHTYTYWNNQYNHYTYGFEYIYEDNGVVFILYNNNWDTLYNMNATIGDSWRMAKQPFLTVCDSNSTLTVTATGNKIINTNSLNYVVVNFNYNSSIGGLQFSDTIVEKIGFINSFMLPYDLCNGVLDSHEGGIFRCYSDFNFGLYQPYYPNNCDFIVDVNELNKNNKIIVYPNPFNEHFTIKNTDNIKIEEIKIFDVFGRLILNEMVTQNNIIQRNNLPSGIYFYQVISENKIISSGKIIAE